MLLPSLSVHFANLHVQPHDGWGVELHISLVALDAQAAERSLAGAEQLYRRCLCWEHASHGQHQGAAASAPVGLLVHALLRVRFVGAQL